MEKANVDALAFLGEEFLIWLWWCAETRGGVYAVGKDERIGIALDRLLEFYDEATGVRVVVRGDAPTRAPEAREALSRGMRLARAGLIVTLGQENADVVLDGQTFDLRSIKGEKPEGESWEERDAAALATLFGLTTGLDQVYRAFLLERTRSDWSSTTATELLEWARSAREGRRTSRAAERPTEHSAG